MRICVATKVRSSRNKNKKSTKKIRLQNNLRPAKAGVPRMRSFFGAAKETERVSSRISLCSFESAQPSFVLLTHNHHHPHHSRVSHRILSSAFSSALRTSHALVVAASSAVERAPTSSHDHIRVCHTQTQSGRPESHVHHRALHPPIAFVRKSRPRPLTLVTTYNHPHTPTASASPRNHAESRRPRWSHNRRRCTARRRSRCRWRRRHARRRWSEPQPQWQERQQERRSRSIQSRKCFHPSVVVD